MALKDTLANLRQQEEQKALWEKDRPKLIQDWRESVANLLKEIQGYLAEYQADGSISFLRREIELSEEQLGSYRIKALSIVAGPATVVVAPVGRMIIGAFGRVDMYRQGRAGESNRIMLLRLQTSSTDPTLRWSITLPEIGAPSVGPGRRVPLDKSALEQALEFLLGR